MNLNKLLRVVSATLLAFILFSVAPSLKAQSPNEQNAKQADSPEVQQLKERLQRLEQTVQELKGQINTLEDAQKKPEPAIVEATYTAPATPLPPKLRRSLRTLERKRREHL